MENNSFYRSKLVALRSAIRAIKTARVELNTVIALENNAYDPDIGELAEYDEAFSDLLVAEKKLKNMVEPLAEICQYEEK